MVGKIKIGACYYDMRSNAFITPLEYGKLGELTITYVYRCEVEYMNEGHEVVATKEQYIHEADFSRESILDTSLFETKRVMELANKATH